MADSSRGAKRPRAGVRVAGVRRWIIAVAALAIVLPAAGIAGWLLLSGSGESGPPSAAIVDQLSLTFPNQDFIDEATAILTGAGYVVDYFPGEEVTVEFYRLLPDKGYDMILLRAHSDRLEGEWQGEPVDETILFTSEAWDDDLYLEDRANKRLTSARYFDGGDRFFGISPDFVEDRMKGGFDGALIIAMGCDATGSSRTAEAFINKGASAFIGWNELVSASHTDLATETLLRHLVIDDLPAQEAVSQTMADVGPDPAYHSELHIFPAEASGS